MTQAAYRMSAKRRASAQTDFKRLANTGLFLTFGYVALSIIIRVNALIG